MSQRADTLQYMMVTARGQQEETLKDLCLYLLFTYFNKKLLF